MNISVIVLASLVTAVPSLGLAQEMTAPARYNTVAVAAGNIALGVVAGGLGRAIRGKRIDRRAIAGGAIGGGLVFTGKAIVSENSGWANLLGRELAAVGSSGIRNVGAGRAFTSHLSLPWGPIRVHVTRSTRPTAQVKLDLATTVATAVAFANEMEFDFERSLINGIAVFEVDSLRQSSEVGGSHSGGVVRLRSRAEGMEVSSSTIRRIIGHEMVHVVQSDFLFNVLSEPVEKRVMEATSGGRFIHRYVDLGLNAPLSSGLNSLVTYEKRPWEREAVTLAGRK